MLLSNILIVAVSSVSDHPRTKDNSRLIDLLKNVCLEKWRTDLNISCTAPSLITRLYTPDVSSG